MINQEILNLQTLLKPEEPVEVTSQDVKPYLVALGWEEGDKLPGGMQEYTAAVLKVLGKAVTMKNLNALFEDETVQLTLKSALNKVKMIVNEKTIVNNKVKELVPNPEQLHANTVDTVLQIAEKVAKEEIAEEAKMNVAEEDAVQIEGLEDIGDDDDDDEEETVNSDIPEAVPHVCPRCGYDVATPYNPYPATNEDKLAYVYSVLGGTPFRKTYDVFNNLLHITFATPTTDLMRMIETQLKYDQVNGKLKDSTQYFIQALRYNCAVNLESIKSTAGLDRTAPVISVYDNQFHTPGETNLAKYVDYIEKDVIGNSTREEFVRTMYSEFVKLQAFLRNKIKDENFIKAVLEKGY